jgi:hypothetical protein
MGDLGARARVPRTDEGLRVAKNRKELSRQPASSVFGDSWSAVLGRVALILLFLMLIAVGFFMRHA